MTRKEKTKWWKWRKSEPSVGSSMKMKTILESVNAEMPVPAPNLEMSPNEGLAKLRKAPSSRDPLGAVRELIPNDGKDEQQLVVYAYACILETNSAGLSILFDRYDEHELRKIDSALESIGASDTKADLHEMFIAFGHALTSGRDRAERFGSFTAAA